MQALKGIALTLCGILVVTSGASLLLPDSKFKKLLSYIISLVIIMSVIGALNGVNFDLSLPASAADNSQNVENMTAQQAQYIIEAYLKENGISVQKVLCYMDILENGDIVISKACVYTSADAQSVEKMLVDGFGIQEVKVYVE